MTDDDKLAGLYEKFGTDFAKGSVIFLEGSTGDEMYLIREGTVEVSKTYREIEVDKETRLFFGTSTQVLAVLGPGDFFGEMSLLNERERSATALAVDDVKLVVINHESFEHILGGTNRIVVQMLKSLSNRLREADAHPRLVPKMLSHKPVVKEQQLKDAEAIHKPAAATASQDIGIIKTRAQCSHCHANLPSDAKFCLDCGAATGNI